MCKLNIYCISATVGMRIIELSTIQMVKTNPIIEWYIIQAMAWILDVKSCIQMVLIYQAFI